MNFLRLRADHHAQYEIRVYADIMLDTLKRWVPITYDAFMDYRVGGTEVSAKGKIIIQKLLKGENVNIDNSGLSKENGMNLWKLLKLKIRLFNFLQQILNKFLLFRDLDPFQQLEFPYLHIFLHQH